MKRIYNGLLNGFRAGFLAGFPRAVGRLFRSVMLGVESQVVKLKLEVMRQVILLSPGGNLRLEFRNYYHAMTATPQRGAMTANYVVSIFVGIVLLVVVIQFLWQQGIPAVLEATSNTTALTTAGATASQVNWATFIGGIMVILLLVAALIMAVRSVGIGGGGGGGHKRKRK